VSERNAVGSQAAANKDVPMWPVIAGAAGGLLLLLGVIIAILMHRRQRQGRVDIQSPPASENLSLQDLGSQRWQTDGNSLSGLYSVVEEQSTNRAKWVVGYDIESRVQWDDTYHIRNNTESAETFYYEPEDGPKTSAKRRQSVLVSGYEVPMASHCAATEIMDADEHISVADGVDGNSQGQKLHVRELPQPQPLTIYELATAADASSREAAYEVANSTSPPCPVYHLAAGECNQFLR